MDHHLHLLQPLITTTTTTTTTTTNDAETIVTTTTLSTSRIVIRLITVFFIAIISIWANYEASKGFEITIYNDAHDTPSGRRFDLLFISNGKATRIVLNTNEFVEKILYPDNNLPKKPVDRVTVKLSRRNLTHPVVVNTIAKEEFVILISPSVMEETNVEKAIVSAVQQGMTRVWLWDGEDGAPKSLLDGIVEYVNIVAGFRHLSDSAGDMNSPESDDLCWKDKDRVNLAYFLNYCERLKSGFIVRLNQALKNPWDSRLVDEVLGLPAQQLCTSYYSSTTQLSNGFDLTLESSLNEDS